MNKIPVVITARPVEKIHERKFAAILPIGSSEFRKPV
jgi:hypothetical protein